MDHTACLYYQSHLSAYHHARVAGKYLKTTMSSFDLSTRSASPYSVPPYRSRFPKPELAPFVAIAFASAEPAQQHTDPLALLRLSRWLLSCHKCPVDSALEPHMASARDG